MARGGSHSPAMSDGRSCFAGPSCRRASRSRPAGLPAAGRAHRRRRHRRASPTTITSTPAKSWSWSRMAIVTLTGNVPERADETPRRRPCRRSQRRARCAQPHPRRRRFGFRGPARRGDPQRARPARQRILQFGSCGSAVRQSPRIRTGPVGLTSRAMRRRRIACGACDAPFPCRPAVRSRPARQRSSRIGRRRGRRPRSPAGWNIRGRSRCCRRRQLPRHRAPGPPAPRCSATGRVSPPIAACRPCGPMARAACSTWNWHRISRAAIASTSAMPSRARRKRRHRRGDGDAVATTLHDVRVIYRQQPKLVGPNHFGSRIAFDRQRPCLHQPGRALRPHARAATRQAAGQAGAAEPGRQHPGRQPVRRPHRTRGRRSGATAIATCRASRWIRARARCGKANTVRAAATRSTCRAAGKNYGWPIISNGMDYSTDRPYPETHRHPCARHGIAVLTCGRNRRASAGMAFYVGHPQSPWNNSLFLGALADRNLIRLSLDGDRIVGEERLLTDLGARIRDVRVGGDGSVYVLTDEDNGRLLQPAAAIVRAEPTHASSRERRMTDLDQPAAMARHGHHAHRRMAGGIAAQEETQLGILVLHRQQRAVGDLGLARPRLGADRAAGRACSFSTSAGLARTNRIASNALRTAPPARRPPADSATRRPRMRASGLSGCGCMLARRHQVQRPASRARRNHRRSGVDGIATTPLRRTSPRSAALRQLHQACARAFEFRHSPCSRHIRGTQRRATRRSVNPAAAAGGRRARASACRRSRPPPAPAPSRSGENCGLRREPANRRTSTSALMPASRSMPTNIVPLAGRMADRPQRARMRDAA